MNKKILLWVLCGFMGFMWNLFCQNDLERVENKKIVNEKVLLGIFNDGKSYEKTDSDELVVDECEDFDFDEFDIPNNDECISEQNASLLQQIIFLIKHPSITWYITKQKTRECKEVTFLYFKNNGKYYVVTLGVVGVFLLTYCLLNTYGNFPCVLYE
jgi:hypothetical protein